MNSEFVIRVERGHAEPEELAALTALLLARAASRATVAATAAEEPRTIAHWRRLERVPGLYVPHSWQAVA